MPIFGHANVGKKLPKAAFNSRQQSREAASPMVSPDDIGQVQAKLCWLRVNT
jgi:hypothetical protein